jgi:transcriptional regulator with XRE-family HTH domain
VPVDDRTVGLVLRALRRRRGWRQVDLAARAGSSQTVVSEIERGHLTATPVRTLRSLFGAVEARLLLEPRWRGAELDRLLDVDHAAIVEAVARRLERAGWQALVEVTYALGAERGSIDVLALQPTRRAALVIEVKSDIPSAEATARKLDEKRRLASSIVQARAGWTPAIVGAVLVLPESVRLRRLLKGSAAALARAFPVASRSVSSWLQDPVSTMAATWFLSDIAARNARRVRTGPSRRPRVASAGNGVDAIVDLDPHEPPVRILR